MKDNEFKKFTDNYEKYVLHNDPHVPPTQGRSSGSEGRLFEPRVKIALGCTRGEIVSDQNRIDVRKNGYSIEIKQGFGTELATIQPDGTLKSPLLKSDYIIYCPDFVIGCDIDVNLQSYVLPAVAFFNTVIELGLTRKKRSTPMQKRYKNGNTWYYDRISLQVNSNKKRDILYDFLENNSITIKDFLNLPNKKDL